MARKKEEPIITQTELLAIAGRYIQKTIIDLRKELAEMEEKAVTDELRKMVSHFRTGTDKQVAYHMERLEAVETMYRFQTGTELGLIAELG